MDTQITRENFWFKLAECWEKRANKKGLKFREDFDEYLDGEHPNAPYLRAELEFYLGAFNAACVFAGKFPIQDEHMSDLDPVVLFSGMRGDSITKTFLELKSKKG